MIQNGHSVTDVVTGFKGVVVAIHTYLNGCTRVTVQPPIDSSGNFQECQTFDEPQLKLLKKKALACNNETGGPEKFSGKRKY